MFRWQARTDRHGSAPRRLSAACLHSDFHHEHLHVGQGGELTGVLDFADAFVGSLAWDFAQLHGAKASEAVAGRHPDGTDLAESGRLVAGALGIYTLGKSPGDPKVMSRLKRLLLG